MLLELRVENYAVIDNVVVEFAPGLNLLTGETGAGKSILIDALTLLLGEKASSDVVRSEAEKAVVTATFEFEPEQAATVTATLEANGIEIAADQVILRREIFANGRGRVFVCNQPATVAVLKQLAPQLAAVHAQRESIVSFDAETRRTLLDNFIGVELQPVADAHARWAQLRDRLAELQRDEQERLRLVDLWSFQKKEIAGANLRAGEDEELETEKRVLANAEKIYAAARAAYESLYESNASAAALMGSGYRQIQEITRYDPKFEESLSALDSARITVEEIGASLRDYAEAIDVSPERLAEVEDRLATLDRLKRKYGPALGHVIEYGAEIARKLSDIENKDEVLRKLHRELAESAAEYLAQARRLSQRRLEGGRKLQRLVEEEINELAMSARFKVEVSSGEEEANWTSTGFDMVEYLFSANPGEPPRAVQEIASGGELSRVMLALKVVVEKGNPGKKKHGQQRTLVFDEIDIGIGGRAAEAVGRKLKDLAETQQVLCITHLPQIASFADHHHLIEKSAVDGRARTVVRRLTDAGRREELARMLSGARLTDASRKHAEQMLKANA